MFEVEILPNTSYNPQITYLSENGKLLKVTASGGTPSSITLEDDAPSIVEKCIQVDKLITTEHRKIYELGTIFNNNRYVIDWTDVFPDYSGNFNDCYSFFSYIYCIITKTC